MSNLTQPANRLLAALPNPVYQRLFPFIKQVKLPQHQVLFHAGDNYDYAYFPTNAMVSSVAIMENGSTAEIGIIGNQGMVGLPIILNTGYTNSTAIVQVGGYGCRIAARTLQNELSRHEALQILLMRYVQARIIQLGQTAACNSHHKIEQRFARWLLTVRDGIQADEFKLTQEFIAQMLGVRRSGVTLIASQFQEAGIIEYRRGFIRIVSNERLEATACECYQLISIEYSRLLNRTDSHNGYRQQH